MIFSGIIAGKNNSYSGINDDDLHVAKDNDLVSGTLTRVPKELLTAAQSLVYNSSFNFPLTNINIIANSIILLGKPSGITTENKPPVFGTFSPIPSLHLDFGIHRTLITSPFHPLGLGVHRYNMITKCLNKHLPTRRRRDRRVYLHRLAHKL